MEISNALVALDKASSDADPRRHGPTTEADGLAAETFVLHPEGYTGPSRIERAEPRR